MNDFLKMIWKESVERFGSATVVDIHIDSEGIYLTTECCAITRDNSITDKNTINGNMLVMLKTQK